MGTMMRIVAGKHRGRTLSVPRGRDLRPTADRVRAMLDYAQRDASELIGYINPDAGSATVEKIAVNAVMAGCLPEYMPVLIAAIQAITEPSFNIHGL